MDASSLENIISSLQLLQESRYSEVAAGALLAYNHVITIDQEIELMWSRRWTLVTYMFLLRRYYNVFLVCYNLASILAPALSVDVSLAWSRWQDATAVIMTVVTEIILVMRLYAMYDRNKYMLYFLVGCIVTSAAVSFTLLSTIFATEHATVTPFPDFNVYSCVANFNSGLAGGFYISSLVIETVFFLLAVFKGIQYMREKLPSFGQRPRISDVLLRDSIMYFFLIFATYFVAALYWFVGGTTHVELAGGFVFAIPAIMSEKLLLHIREHYHGLEVSSDEPILPIATLGDFREFQTDTASISSPISPVSPTTPTCS